MPGFSSPTLSRSGAFLFAHGVSGGASLALRAPVSGYTRTLLTLSQRSAMVSSPALVLILITGIWLTFAGHWSSRVWPWAALVVLVAVTAVMVCIARSYYVARDAMGGPDDALAARLSHARPGLALWIGVPPWCCYSGSWCSNLFDLNTDSGPARYLNWTMTNRAPAS